MEQKFTNKNSIVNLLKNVKLSIDEISENILQTYEREEIEDFANFVREDYTEQPRNLTSISAFRTKTLNRLVPNIHKSYVLSIIKNQFGNDEQKYLETVPLFAQHFTVKDKRICDDEIVALDKADRRKLNRKKKHLIIFSMQLLKLVGLKRSSILTNDCLSHYKNEMQKTDDFLENFRLLNAEGKITKLTSNDSKQKQKLAQILNISQCLDQMAKDRGYTFSLVTLTIPPAYHCNPMNGTSPFKGYTPQEALNQLNAFWQSIRSHLSKIGLKFGPQGLFGIQVLELQKSSTLHLHCLIYSSEYDVARIHNVVKKVKNIHNNKFPVDGKLNQEQLDFNRLHRIKDFDIKLNDGRKDNGGAKYVFKYITKTHSNYKNGKADDSALKNMACRYFYGCRGFNFFGVKSCITKFNFVLKYHLSYKDKLPKEILQSLKKASYYDFVTKYQKFFNNEYFKDGKEKRLLGVSFAKSAYECEKHNKIQTVLHNEVILMEKRQYSVFQKNYEDEFKKLDDLDEKLDIDQLCYANIRKAYVNVQRKQKLHDEAKEEFVSANAIQIIGRDEKKQKKAKSYLDILLGKAVMKFDSSLGDVLNKLHLFKTIQENPVLTDYELPPDEYDVQEVVYDLLFDEQDIQEIYYDFVPDEYDMQEVE